MALPFKAQANLFEPHYHDVIADHSLVLYRDGFHYQFIPSHGLSPAKSIDFIRLALPDCLRFIFDLAVLYSLSSEAGKLASSKHSKGYSSSLRPRYFFTGLRWAISMVSRGLGYGHQTTTD